MTQPPEFPLAPEPITARVAAFGSEEVPTLAQSVVSSDLGRGLGEPFARPELDPIVLADPAVETQLLTVHLALEDTEPLVWRRLSIPGDLDLAQVHDVLQAAMGWTDSHLHRFFLGDPWSGPHFVTQYDDDEEQDGVQESDARLDRLLREPGDTLGYTYDFGDDWTHTLLLEQVGPLTGRDQDATTARTGPGNGASPAAYVICLDGARACPPEDVGGISGYEEMATWARHGFDAEHLPELGIDPADLRAWLPDGWHPDVFSLQEVNRDLARLRPRATHAVLAQLPKDLRTFIARLPPEPQEVAEGWAAAGPWSEAFSVSERDAQALTAPLLAVLDAVGDGLKLTDAGNLPPRVVQTVFTSLELGREWIGKGNREDLTPPVADLRRAVQDLGLLRKAKGRLLPTVRGRAVAGDPSALARHVIGRLPLEEDSFGRLAALVSLLAVAGGTNLGLGVNDQDRRALIEAVRDMLAAAGWCAGSEPLQRRDVLDGIRGSLDLLSLMLRRSDSERLDAGLAQGLACEILRRAQ